MKLSFFSWIKQKTFYPGYVLLFLAFPVWAEQLIVEPEMGRKPILERMNQAQHSISLVMYGLTDSAFTDALLRQQKKGKTVRVILERSPYKAAGENAKAIAAFEQQHVNWQGHIPPFRLIHQKTLLIDNREAIVMTFNFTRSTFKNERNFGLVLDNPEQVHTIANIFSADWNHVPFHNTTSTLLVSPDDSREKLLALIKEAQQSIHMYAQQINDYHLVGALAAAAKRGVDVEILTSAKIREKQAKFLERAGVKVQRSASLYIHAKAMVIDHKKLLLGSINFTRASLDDNRELAVVTTDASVVKQLEEIFAKDWVGNA